MNFSSSSTSHTSEVTLSYEVELAIFQFGIKKLTSFFNILDWMVRFYSILVHAAYFYFVIKIKELRKRELIYLHHTNAISLLFCVHYTLYLGSTRPQVGNELANRVLCLVSECIWTINKFLRCYSILLLTIYRYLGVYKIYLYKKINLNLVLLLTPILFTWLVAFIFYALTKFTFGTLPGKMLCYDGFSTNLTLAFWYYLVNALFGIILPTGLVMYIFLLIKRKLVILAMKFRKEEKAKKKRWRDQLARTIDSVSKMVHSSSRKEKIRDGETSVSTASAASAKKRSGKNLVLQFFLMIVFVVISSISFLVLSVGNLVPNIDDFYGEYRQFMSILVVFFQSKIPLISMLFHPSIVSMVHTQWSCRGRKIVPVNDQPLEQNPTFVT